MVRVPDLKLQPRRNLTLRLIPWKERLFPWNNYLFLRYEIIERIYKSPVKIPLARQRPIVYIRVLAIFGALQPPERTTRLSIHKRMLGTWMILPFDVYVRHFFAGEESIILQNDVIRVPYDNPEFVGFGLSGRDVQRRTRQGHVHREHVNPHLQFSLKEHQNVKLEEKVRKTIIENGFFNKLSWYIAIIGIHRSINSLRIRNN